MEELLYEDGDFLFIVDILEVVNVGNLIFIYFYLYDEFYMGVYNGSVFIILRLVFFNYVGYVCDFLFYNGSIFFVVNYGSVFYLVSDSVFRFDLKILNVIGEWGFLWEVRDMIVFENVGIIFYVWVNFGLDNKNCLWVCVDMIFLNIIVYYFYYNGDFEFKNEIFEGFYIFEVKVFFDIVVEDGIRYELFFFFFWNIFL